MYKGTGEKSIEASAAAVGLKLPKQPMDAELISKDPGSAYKQPSETELKSNQAG